jgi:hypothetical protein
MLVAESAEDARRLLEAGLCLPATYLDAMGQLAMRSFCAGSRWILASVSS